MTPNQDFSKLSEFGIHGKLQTIDHAEEGASLLGSANFMMNSFDWICKRTYDQSRSSCCLISPAVYGVFHSFCHRSLPQWRRQCWVFNEDIHSTVRRFAEEYYFTLNPGGWAGVSSKSLANTPIDVRKSVRAIATSLPCQHSFVVDPRADSRATNLS